VAKKRLLGDDTEYVVVNDQYADITTFPKRNTSNAGYIFSVMSVPGSKLGDEYSNRKMVINHSQYTVFYQASV
jgi:hypothetical protein